MINKPMSNKEYIRLCIEHSKNKYEQAKQEEYSEKLEQANIDAQTSAIFEQQDMRRRKNHNFNVFSENVRNTLLGECIHKIFDQALGIKFDDEITKAIKKNLVNNFVIENGAISLLSRFRDTSNLLSEFSLLVNKYHKLIIEAADKDNEESYSIDPVIKDNFFDELDMQDVGSVVASIRMRVTDAVEEFIQNNINDKIDIETTLRDAQDKINAAKMDEVKESYQILAKRKISETRNNRVKNVFSCLVENMCATVVKNDALHEEFMKDNKIDIDKIVERCELMYTFLETVNTTKMISIDEAYIEEVLNSMKQ